MRSNCSGEVPMTFGGTGVALCARAPGRNEGTGEGLSFVHPVDDIGSLFNVLFGSARWCMRIVRTSTLVFTPLLALILGGGTGVIAWKVHPNAAWLGVFIAVLVLAIGFRQALRRWRVARQSISEGTRAWLQTHVPLYGMLSRARQTRFERDMAFVLDEYTFEGVDGVRVTEDLQRSVAAGIALLLHGRPSWECPGSTTVLFYPGRFNEGYVESRDASFDGMAHEQGPIILSAPAVRASWAGTGRADNVVLHELAHLFDFDNEGADGVPSFVASASTGDWQALIRREMDRVERGRSLLRPYAAESPSEFFAVAVETFFELPDEMADRHPSLFQALRAFFHLDPRTGERITESSKTSPVPETTGD